MIFHRIKSNIVSHFSYFIGSGKDVVVVDPHRDIQEYLFLTRQHGVNIKYIFETHRNEDYVTGSRELAHHTGAIIYHGPWPELKYGEKLMGGEEFKVGNLKIHALHTPGHTPGCISYIVTDLETGDEPLLVCTGDTLFIGEVGRTDLGGPDNRIKWSNWLFESIHEKLLPLGDHIILCPAHGSGSVCGTRIAKRELSTIGAELLMNPLLKLSREEFIEYKDREHHEFIPYFKMMEKYNVEGAPFYGIGPQIKALSPKEFKESVNKGATVIDTRPPPSYGAGHIKGAYSLAVSRLGLAGWVLPYNKDLLLVLSNQKQLDTVVKNLGRIGYDNVKGYLKGTMVSWYMASMKIESLDLMTVFDLKEKLDRSKNWTVLDVRSIEEYEEGHIEDSLHIYVGTLPKHLDKIPKKNQVGIICKSGTRSSFASSILLREGFHNIHNVLGGMSSWKKAEYPITS
jgi:hydroxyacylglutathione hydrolase